MSSILYTRICKAFLNRHTSATMTLSFLLCGTMVAIPTLSVYAQGVSFGTPTRIVGTVDKDAEPPTITGSGKNVYIIWHEFSDPNQNINFSDIYFSRSTNRGETFDLRENLSNSALVTSDQEEIAASGKNVYVVWIETSNVPEVYFTSSTDGGATFSSPTKLSDVGNPKAPRIAASGKNVYVAWEAEGPLDALGNTQTDIFFTHSSDAGVSFSTPPQNISANDGLSEFRDAALHQIEVSGKNVIVTWRDTSIAGAGYEIFFTQGQ